MPRFIAIKWVEVHDQPGSAEDRYKSSKQIRFKTLMLRSDLCDFSEAYTVVKGNITLTKDANRTFIDVRERILAFKNNVLFTKCISKINKVLIDNAEDLDVIMPLYNLLEYSKNYRKARGSLWNYYSDEPDNPLNDDDPLTVICNPVTIKNSESFKSKNSITGKTSNENQENGENTEQENTKTKTNLEIVAPLEHLSNFWRGLEIHLINCTVSLNLTRSEKCVLTNIITKAANPNADPAILAINAPTNATFKIKDTKFYVPVVTLSTQDDNKFLERSKSGFKRIIKWNKYRSEMTNQTKTNNLNYLLKIN